MKKTHITQYVAGYSKNFCNEIRKRLPKGIADFRIEGFGMTWEGYGTYEYLIEIYVDGERLYLSSITHDSTSYDFWKYERPHVSDRTSDNFIKRKVLMLLESDIVQNRIESVLSKTMQYQ